MKTIISFSLLCALLLLLLFLAPLAQSWGASHQETLKNASTDLQMGPGTDLFRIISVSPYGSVIHEDVGNPKTYFASGYARGRRHGYWGLSRSHYGGRHLYRYQQKFYHGKKHAYSPHHMRYFGGRVLYRDYFKGYNAGRYGYKPYPGGYYNKGNTYRYPYKKYWYYYDHCY